MVLLYICAHIDVVTKACFYIYQQRLIIARIALPFEASIIAMELQISHYIVNTFFLILLVRILIAKISTKKLPPGPWKMPVIGNIHQLIGLPAHQALRNLSRKYGPLMHLQLGEVSNIVVSSPEMAKEVLRTHDAILANRPVILMSKIMCYDSTDIVFSQLGAYWRQLRKICTTELLSANRVQAYRSFREEEVSKLIEMISSNENSIVNFSKEIFSFTYGITGRAAFGKKCKDQEAFISVIREAVEQAGAFAIADFYPSSKLLEVISGLRPKLEKLHKEGDRILGDIIRDHIESRKTNDDESEDDLVHVLLRCQEQSDLEVPLTEQNIRAVIHDVFSAGSETSSTTIEWALSEMLKNPSIMAEAQAEVRRVYDKKEYVDESNIHELKYLNAVIKETLRLHPPAPLLIPRETKTACKILQYEIPAKTRIIVNSWAIGRDPEYWTEPEKFLPERFLNTSISYKGTDYQYIPFGAGRRICPGIIFAIANIELPLANLLYHFDWRLPNGMKHGDLDMTESPGISVRRREDLCLIPTRYHLSPSLQNTI